MSIIQKFICVLQRADPIATDSVETQDDIWGYPKPVDDGTQSGASSVQFGDEIEIICQIRRKIGTSVNAQFGSTKLDYSGTEREYDIIITVERKTLKKLGLLDSSGHTDIHIGDKIKEIKTKKGVVEYSFDDPEMIIEEVEEAGYGLNYAGTPRFNLCNIYCKGQASTK